MLKKLFPVALVGLLAGGCAAYQEALSIKDELQTFLVRSITLNKGGNGDCTIALIWGGTTPLTGIQKGTKGSTAASTSVNVNTSSSFATDSVVPEGQTYLYKATFQNGKSYTRYIAPFTKDEPGLVDATKPAAIPAMPTTLSLANTTFEWKITNGAIPSGFLVTVGEAGSLSDFSGVTPIYTAFIEAASHSIGADTYSVKYGTPSDMAVMSKEMTDILGKMDPRFAVPEGNGAALSSGKNYFFIVSPLKVDSKATVFGVGNQSAGVFQVQ